MCLQAFTTLTLLLEGDKMGSIITDLRVLKPIRFFRQSE